MKNKHDTIICKSAEETKSFAASFAKRLKGGEVIGLNGDLGAGKTTFCQGLAAALGVTDTVNSPTFVIMKIYATGPVVLPIKTLVHIDAYRLNSIKDLEAIGALEYFGRDDAVVLVEWSDKLKIDLDYLANFKNIFGVCEIRVGTR